MQRYSGHMARLAYENNPEFILYNKILLRFTETKYFPVHTDYNIMIGIKGQTCYEYCT